MLHHPQTLPSEHGIYVLMLRLKQDRTLTVGKLGLIAFEAGWYAYVGSAFGPGGVAARLKRHFKADKKSHWHIDYLRCETQVVGVWIGSGPRHMEHEWAARMMAPPVNGRPAIGFGCTDCPCRSHLVHFRRIPSLKKVKKTLQARWIRIVDNDP